MIEGGSACHTVLMPRQRVLDSYSGTITVSHAQTRFSRPGGACDNFSRLQRVERVTGPGEMMEQELRKGSRAEAAELRKVEGAQADTERATELAARWEADMVEEVARFFIAFGFTG